MGNTEDRVSTATQKIRQAAAELASHRGGPCLIFVSQSLLHADVLTVRRVLGEMQRLISPGTGGEFPARLGGRLPDRRIHLTPIASRSMPSASCQLVPGS